MWKYCKIRTKIIIFNLISVGFKQYFLDYIQIFILGVETKKKLINLERERERERPGQGLIWTPWAGLAPPMRVLPMWCKASIKYAHNANLLSKFKLSPRPPATWTDQVPLYSLKIVSHYWSNQVLYNCLWKNPNPAF